MNNVSSLKANKTESPKTPGGISKSLLTPCRRVGLSRNWKRKGPSPFISPLSGTEEVKQEKTETRRCRKRVIEEELGQSPKSSGDSQDAIVANDNVGNDGHIEKTPSRNIEIPCRKKTKTLISAISKCQETIPLSTTHNTDDKMKEISLLKHQENAVICTPVSHKDKRTKKSPQTSCKEQNSSELKETNFVIRKDNTNDINLDKKVSIKEKSPKELTKECIVVIQKKIFKQKSCDLEKLNSITDKCSIINEQKTEKIPSQVLFDSDSDDVPLGKLNKNENLSGKEQVINLDEDDDFTDTSKPNIKKLEAKNLKCKETEQKISVIKKSKDIKHKEDKSKKSKLNLEISKPSQSSFDDEEDFDFTNKKTILIRKSYEKGTKLLKAKSTGSITQKDIDNLHARIEAKKKLLIAKSMTDDTKELRELVKKWQSGCQNALMELMELMRSKFPDKQNMDYSEILQTLKIPASLVGYDSENDCFITPDDTTIILSGLNL